MKHVGDLLARLSLPADPDGPPDPEGGDADLERRSEGAICRPDWLHELSAGLPAGHLHLWGGPPGVGKTSFLLSLLHAEAWRGRRSIYATYHLAASSLAMRLLAMAAGLDVEALTTGELSPAEARHAARTRRCLARLPIWILEARGFSVASLADRASRLPFRADVLAVDYLQAVIRPTGTDLGHAVRGFTALASRLHMAVVVALQGAKDPPLASDAGRPGSAELLREKSGPFGADLAPLALADRAGWIVPALGVGRRRVEVIRNRYGERASVPLRIDPATGAFARAEEEPPAH